MRANLPGTADGNSDKSFSRQVREEVAGLNVKKPEDRRSLAAGLMMPGTRIRGEAEEVLCKCKDIKNTDQKVALDLQNGARLFLRGAFLACGYVTDPKQAYRVELRPVNSEASEVITGILSGLDIPYSEAQRGEIHAVYISSGDGVSDFLGIIGASSCRLTFENIRIEREVYSDINRAVNCDSGNTGRQAEAAVRRGELIGKLLASPEAEKLPKSLYEAAVVHQQNPGASIAELGSMMNPPIGKSGMNHRLTRLLEIAEGM
ncbi:MAG: DNA-binding protein WhiA [Clostridiales bacterium]|nr:DNA-binding protein WhiA [Clostridiales bacterium]